MSTARVYDEERMDRTVWAPNPKFFDGELTQTIWELNPSPMSHQTFLNGVLVGSVAGYG